MANSSTLNLPLGTIAPDFKLPDAVSNKVLSLQQLKSNVATVIMFICNHCPYVKNINTCLVKVANDYQKKGISFIAINANDIDNYPEDSPENMQKTAATQHYPFPYLFDESQEIAKAYHAACTPDFYMFDKNLKCVYRGRFDDSSPGKNTPTGKDLTAALDQLIAGKPISADQKPSIGCGIKWKNNA